MAYVNRLMLRPEVQDFIDALPGPLPSAGYMKALNTVGGFLKNTAWWDNLAAVGILATNDLTNILVNFRNPAKSWTQAGVPAGFSPYQQVVGDHATFALNTNLTAPGSGLGLLDHTIGFHCMTNLPGVSLGDIGARGTGGTQIGMAAQRSGATTGIWSCETTQTIIPSASGIGFKGFLRTQTGTVRYIVNDQLNNVTCIESLLPNDNFYMFRQTKSAVYSSNGFSLFWIGRAVGITDVDVGGFWHTWENALAAFNTLIVPDVPVAITPPHAFRAATLPFCPPGKEILRQFPGVPTNDTSDASSTYNSDPATIAVARPWGTVTTSLETRIKFAEIVWGNRNNFGPPRVNAPNDPNGLITYTTPGVMQTITVTSGGSGYGSNPTFTQTTPSGFSCTLHQTAGVIDTATIVGGGTHYPSHGTLTLTDAGGTGAVINFISTNGVVTTLTVAEGGTGYVSPTGSITVSTGSGYTITATVVGGVVTRANLTGAGTNFPFTGYFTFVDGTGSGAAGTFTAADQLFTCRPEYTTYTNAMDSTNVKLAITTGYRYLKDNNDPAQWGWRNFAVRNGLYDMTAWDSLFTAQSFSTAQAITTTANSSSVVDTGVEAAHSVGYPLWIELDVGTAFAAAGAATLTVKLQSATDAIFTTPVDMVTLPVLHLADLTAGAQPSTYIYGNVGISSFSCTLTQTAGVITAASIIGGGTSGPISTVQILTVTDATGSGAIIRANINSSGVVTSLSILTGGTGYTSPTGALDAACHRYLRLVYTVATGPFTAGTITANTPLGAFRLLGSSYLGPISPWGYYSANASATLFPHAAQAGFTRTCYDLVIPGQARLADLRNVPKWGIAMDCEMDDDRGATLFSQTVTDWDRICSAKGLLCNLGMDAIVGGSGSRLGLVNSNGSALLALPSIHVPVLLSNDPPGGDQVTFVTNQLNVYSGDPAGTVPILYSKIFMQMNPGFPTISTAYAAIGKTIRDTNNMYGSTISPGFAQFGGSINRTPHPNPNDAVVAFMGLAKLTHTLGTNPFTTTNGSTTVTVTDLTGGFSSMTCVTFSGAVGFAGIPSSDLNSGTSPALLITILSATQYTVTVATTASSGTTGGGSIVTAVYYAGVYA